MLEAPLEGNNLQESVHSVACVWHWFEVQWHNDHLFPIEICLLGRKSNLPLIAVHLCWIWVDWCLTAQDQGKQKLLVKFCPYYLFFCNSPGVKVARFLVYRASNAPSEVISCTRICVQAKQTFWVIDSVPSLVFTSSTKFWFIFVLAAFSCVTIIKISEAPLWLPVFSDTAYYHQFLGLK